MPVIQLDSVITAATSDAMAVTEMMGLGTLGLIMLHSLRIEIAHTSVSHQLIFSHSSSKGFHVGSEKRVTFLRSHFICVTKPVSLELLNSYMDFTLQMGIYQDFVIQ